MTRPYPAVPGVEIEHREVLARGMRFHVALAGPPDAEPLVLLHGWPQHWFEWRRVLPGLAERRRCIVPDLRGLGWSEAPPAGYEKETLADDVLAVLDELGVGRTDLVAHDWGGWVGFLIALRAPERLHRYLALNIPPPWGPSRRTVRGALALWRIWYQVVLATPRLGERVAANERAMARAIRADNVHPEAFSDADIAEFTGVLTEPERARASSLYYRDFLRREIGPLLRGRYDEVPLTVPTHLLFGVRDRAISTAQIEHAARPGDPLEIEFVPDSGHFIAEERPDLVLARAREFLGA